jgi:hypothetical protein
MFKPEFLLLFQNPENGTPKHGLEGLCRFLDRIPVREPHLCGQKPCCFNNNLQQKTARRTWPFSN